MSWSPFYEEQSTWANTLADACTAIVNYGVDLPWCVCHTSSSAITTASEYAVAAVTTAAAATGIDAFWSAEWTVAVLCLALNLPIMLGRARAGKFGYNMATQLSCLLSGLAWIGCFLEFAAGIQGGVVFGGQIYYPAVFLLGLAFAGAAHCVDMANYEVFGLGADTAGRDPKVAKPLDFLRRTLVLEAVALYCFAAFGLPKVEADPDVLPWLCVFPVLAMHKVVSAYLAHDPRLQPKQANGSIPNQTKGEEEPAKKEDAAKKDESAKKDDAKKTEAPAAKKEEPTPGTEAAKPAEETAVATSKPSLATCLKNLPCRLASSLLNLTRCLTGALLCVYARVMSLPWDLITNLVIALGMQVTYTTVFWTLTEDPAVLALPVVFYVVPLLVERFADRMTKENAQLARELATATGVCVKYYLFKTNITQAY